MTNAIPKLNVSSGAAGTRHRSMIIRITSALRPEPFVSLSPSCAASSIRHHGVYSNPNKDNRMERELAADLDFKRPFRTQFARVVTRLSTARHEALSIWWILICDCRLRRAWIGIGSQHQDKCVPYLLALRRIVDRNRVRLRPILNDISCDSSDRQPIWAQ
jgi:hypothetical protein